MVEIETGSRIPIWQPFILFKPEIVVDIVITTKFGLLINTGLFKRATSPNPKPEVKLRRSGRHVANQYNVISLLSIV